MNVLDLLFCDVLGHLYIVLLFKAINQLEAVLVFEFAVLFNLQRFEDNVGMLQQSRIWFLHNIEWEFPLVRLLGRLLVQRHLFLEVLLPLFFLWQHELLLEVNEEIFLNVIYKVMTNFAQHKGRGCGDVVGERDFVVKYA